MSEIAVELNVFVSTMSAPASRYFRWIPSMISGCVIDSRSLQPLSSRGWLANSFPR